MDRTNAIKNLDKKRKKDAPKLKEDRKKDEVGTMTRRVESIEGACFKCNIKGHFARDCSAKVKCETCSSDRHVTALHRDDPRSPRSRSRSRDESIRNGSRSRESSLSRRAMARSRRTSKNDSQRSKSPRRHKLRSRERSKSKTKSPRRSKSREEETVDTTRRMLTGTTVDGKEDDDEPPRIVADYVPTPKRPRFTRRIEVTEETDEDEHSSP